VDFSGLEPVRLHFGFQSPSIESAIAGGVRFWAIITEVYRDDYLEQWARFKRLRNAWLVFLVLEMSPFDRWVQPLLHRLLPSVVRLVSELDRSSWFLWGWLSSVVTLIQWKCPRCVKPFAGGRKTMDSRKDVPRLAVTPKKCISCGLPKYATDPSSEAVAPSSL